MDSACWLGVKLEFNVLDYQNALLVADTQNSVDAINRKFLQNNASIDQNATSPYNLQRSRRASCVI